MTETSPGSAEQDDRVPPLPSPFDELTTLPSQPDPKDRWTLESVKNFVRAVKFFARHNERFVWILVPEERRVELMERFCQARESVANWASTLAASARSNAKLYRNIRDLLRLEWKEMPEAHANAFSATLRRNANRVLGLAEEREVRQKLKSGAPEQSKTAADPPTDPDPPTADVGQGGQPADPDGAGDSSELNWLENIPLLDMHNGDWVTQVRVANEGRALKLNKSERELTAEDKKRALEALRAARRPGRATRSEAGGTVREDQRKRILRADPDDPNLFWYLTSTCSCKIV